MRKPLFRWAAAALLGAACAPSFASVEGVDCRAFTSTTTSYDDCIGLNRGNTGVAGANSAFVGDPTYGVEYKDNNTGLGSDTTVFDLIDSGNDTVTLSFLQHVGDGTRDAVIALKFGGKGVNQLGYFRFNNADFDAGETLVFSWSPTFGGDGISHASVFSDSLVPGGNVPEPATPALALAGLAAAGLVLRRRRRS